MADAVPQTEKAVVRGSHGHFAKGTANPAGMTRHERIAYRTLSETLRSLARPEDLGTALLSIFAGVDPFADDPRRKKRGNPDGLPTPGAIPLDWTHRMQALKMFMEYGYGKPLQGVVVEAAVRQEVVHREERTHVVELRELAGRSPAARAALRVLATEALATPPPSPAPDAPTTTEEAP